MPTEFINPHKGLPLIRGGSNDREAISRIIRDLDSETITFNGDTISMLEAGIRLLYARSLKGDLAASVELQRVPVGNCVKSISAAARGRRFRDNARGLQCRDQLPETVTAVSPSVYLPRHAEAVVRNALSF